MGLNSQNIRLHHSGNRKLTSGVGGGGGQINGMEWNGMKWNEMKCFQSRYSKGGAGGGGEDEHNYRVLCMEAEFDSGYLDMITVMCFATGAAFVRAMAAPLLGETIKE